jgi:glycosyltransferase involved in cell wall biosynthesis
MKLALCLEYPIGLRGGVSVLAETLLAELHRHGHQIVLVSEDTAESFHDHPVASLACHFISWNSQQPSRANARRLAQQLADAKVDLAHFHQGGTFGWGNRFPFRCPILYLDRMGIPCVSTAHRAMSILDGFCGPQRSFWFKMSMLPLAWSGKFQQLQHTRMEIAVSQENWRKLRRWYWPLSDRFVHIYHSRLRESVSEAPSALREPFILNVGHMAPEKGQVVLAQAFAQIAKRNPQWKLLFAGHDQTGASVRQLRRISREQGLEDRILLLGEQSDAAGLMSRSAIYVQPSLSEALGLALQEALFFACPAIGSRVGGIPELIDDGRTGLLVQPGNVAQLAAALENLINDKSRRENLGRAAAVSIREKGMTVDAMIKHHLELYETVARKK